MSRLRARYRARNTGGFSAKEFLDIYGQGAIHAWSTVLLKSGVTDGTDLRRSSDGDEDTFGYAEGILDEVGIESFVGGGDGFNKTLYDQVGNLDLAQSTDTRQPQLVSAGVMDKIDGVPFINFGTQGTIFANAISEINDSTTFSVDLLIETGADVSSQQTVFINRIDASNIVGGMIFVNRLYLDCFSNGGYISISPNTKYYLTLVYNGTAVSKMFVNGVDSSFSIATSGSLGNSTAGSIQVGGNVGNTTRVFEGKISTLIFYDEAKDLAHHQAFNDFFF